MGDRADREYRGPSDMWNVPERKQTPRDKSTYIPTERERLEALAEKAKIEREAAALAQQEKQATADQAATNKAALEKALALKHIEVMQIVRDDEGTGLKGVIYSEDAEQHKARYLELKKIRVPRTPHTENDHTTPVYIIDIPIGGILALCKLAGCAPLELAVKTTDVAMLQQLEQLQKAYKTSGPAGGVARTA